MSKVNSSSHITSHPVSPCTSHAPRHSREQGLLCMEGRRDGGAPRGEWGRQSPSGCREAVHPRWRRPTPSCASDAAVGAVRSHLRTRHLLTEKLPLTRLLHALLLSYLIYNRYCVTLYTIILFYLYYSKQPYCHHPTIYHYTALHTSTLPPNHAQLLYCSV